MNYRRSVFLIAVGVGLVAFGASLIDTGPRILAILEAAVGVLLIGLGAYDFVRARRSSDR